MYLEYLQDTFEENARAMKMRTKALVKILKQKVSVASAPHLAWGRWSQGQLGNAKPIQERWPQGKERI